MKTNRQACIVRAKPHGKDREDQFLIGGIASLGYPDLGNLRNSKSQILSFEEISQIMKVEYEDVNNISLATTQVFAFATLPIGSIILTPSIKTRDIHLLETTSEYYFDEKAKTEDIGNPHQIRVKHLRTVARSVFPSEFQSMLNAAKKAVTKLQGRNEETVFALAYGNSPPPSVLPEAVEAKIEKTLLGLLESDSREIRIQAAIKLLDSSSEKVKLRAIEILNQ
jgi:hypothetical protein